VKGFFAAVPLAVPSAAAATKSSPPALMLLLARWWRFRACRCRGATAAGKAAAGFLGVEDGRAAAAVGAAEKDARSSRSGRKQAGRGGADDDDQAPRGRGAAIVCRPLCLSLSLSLVSRHSWWGIFKRKAHGRARGGESDEDDFALFLMKKHDFAW